MYPNPNPNPSPQPHNPAPQKSVGIPSDAVDMMASDAMLQTRLLVNNPVEVTEADAAVLYRQIGGWA